MNRDQEDGSTFKEPELEPGADARSTRSENLFPVVALGASAGGLDALRQLLSHLPSDSGMAFVVIQHLDPETPSMLSKILEAITPLRVVEATDGMRVEPDRVHVIPSDCDLSIDQGTLALGPRQLTRRLHLPIDSFFRSLAADSRRRAIGVVLSGSGSDGSEGLRAIKAEGGIAVAQDPDSAQFGSMPESALAAGVVDYSGTPAEIARELLRLARHPYVADAIQAGGTAPEPGLDDERSLAAIFAVLREHAGVDFGGYRRSTVLRRAERRMALRRVSSLAEYARALPDDPAEARALARDMLIHVTAFFRDAEAFAALQEQVFPELIARKEDGGGLRLWIPGCSTGEEAYAVTICLLEALAERSKQLSIKIFASDLSEEAIDTARLGVYPEAALADVSPERLARFFERTEGGYRVGRRLRDHCIFVKHDLTRDPPFARLDLVSCRNVLIYFDAELQRRVVAMLHYCLTDRGYLFLGQSETLTASRDLFAAVDKEHRIFVKSGQSPRHAYHLPASLQAAAERSAGAPPERRQPARTAERQADQLLLARYAPPGVIINDRLDVVQFRGRTGDFLEPASGEPQANLLRMARAGLLAHLHEGVERAKAQTTTIRKERVQLEGGAEARFVDLEIVPLAASAHSAERFFLVLFDETGKRPAAPSAAERRGRSEPAPEEAASETARLSAELAVTNDYVRWLVSEHQTTTDELAAANEELVAANEELQSSIEELQSAKEELQSANEELGTLNDELRVRNLELDEVASDLVNVLASVEIPVIMVDLDLRIRRFTPAVRQIASFIPEDIGRSIEHLTLAVDVNDLATRIHAVLADLSTREWEVRARDGRWFRLQIRPYRTTDQRVDGAVLSFVDVNDLKHALLDAEVARDYARSIIETVADALVVVDAEGRVVSANQIFYETFALAPGTAEGKAIFELGLAAFEEPAARHTLEGALGRRQRFAAAELTTEHPRFGPKVLSLSGRPILWGGGATMMLLAFADVTGLRKLEAERTWLLEAEQRARLEAERANRAKDLFLATLSHELRTPLNAMLMSAELLKRQAGDDERILRPSATIERSAKSQARLIDDLLDVSRIVAGKLLLNLAPVDLAATVRDAVDLARPGAAAKALELTLEITGEAFWVFGDGPRLQQVVNNLLNNAIKFTPHDGRVAVRLERVARRAQLLVTDSGMGIRAEVLPKLFSRFTQADSSVTRTHGGLGLGLSIVHYLVEAHGGEVRAESDGEGKGATFRVVLPLGEMAGESAVAGAAVARIDGVRVLLVEDDADTRDSCARMLTELGAVVRAEPSAAAGIAAVESFRPHVILSDIAMPGEDGLSFIRRVRRLAPERGGSVPAAALTALASDEDRQQALAAGFQIHVAKPADAARLAAVVAELAGSR